MKTKYLFFDIDGTLVGQSRQIPSSTIAAFKILKEHGHKLFICTGRAPTTIPSNIYELDVDGFICSAGSYIYLKDRVLSKHCINQEVLEHTIELFDQYKIHYTLESEHALFESKNNARYHKYIFALTFALKNKFSKNLELLRHVKANKNVVKRQPLTRWKGEPISKIDYIAPFKRILKIQKELEKGYDVIIFGRNKLFINGEIINKNYTKATAIDEIIEYNNASLQDTIAFGDTMNDYPMLKHAHISACFKGSEKTLLDLCDYTFDEPENDGIYKVLKEMGMI